MRKNFTPHLDLFLTLNVKVIIGELDLLGMICSEELCPLLRRQIEEIRDGRKYSFAQILRDSMVYDLEEPVLFRSF